MAEGGQDLGYLCGRTGSDYLGCFKVRNASVWTKKSKPNYEKRGSNKRRYFVARQDGKRLQIRLFTLDGGVTAATGTPNTWTLRDIIDFNEDSKVYLENIKASCSRSKDGTAWLACEGKRDGKTVTIRFRPAYLMHFLNASKISDMSTRLFAQYFRDMLCHCTGCKTVDPKRLYFTGSH